MLYTIKVERVEGNIGNLAVIECNDLESAQLIWDTMKYLHKTYIMRSARPQ